MKEWTFQRTFSDTDHKDVVKIQATQQHTAWGRMAECGEKIKEVRLLSVATVKTRCEHPEHDKNCLLMKGDVKLGGSVKNEMLNLPYRRWLKLCRVCAKVEEQRYVEHKNGQQKIEGAP